MLTPTLLWRLRTYDLIHLHCPYVFGAELVRLVSAVRGIPYVITYHQDLVLHGALAPVGAFYQWVQNRLVLPGARWVAVTSEDYGRHSVGAAAASKLVVLPNGADTEHFRPELETSGVRTQLKTDGRPVVLFVGGLDKAHFFKGVPVLLQAAALVPDAVFVILGDGDLRPEYERLARAAGVADRVRFTGFVSTVELPLYYNVADVVALPSTTRGEAFGMVLVEAMSCGTPVIASDLPGVRSVVDREMTGLLVTPGDAVSLAHAITDLLSDPQRRSQMGQAGRKKAVSQYDWAQIGRQLEHLYSQALGRDELSIPTSIRQVL